MTETVLFESSTPNYPPSDYSTNKIKELLQWLCTLEGGGSIKVFGSTLGGKVHPKDLDIFIDLDVCKISDSDLTEIIKRTARGYEPEVKNGPYGVFKEGRYQGLFDPFLNVGGKLFCSDHDSGSWVVVTNKNVAKYGMRGTPLSQFTLY
jgi:hypothetical protein